MEPDELSRWADQVEREHQEWLEWCVREIEKDQQGLSQLGETTA